MLEMYTSPADLRKQQVADLQAKRQEKVTLQLCLPPSACICLPYGSFPQCSALCTWMHALSSQSAPFCVCMHESCCVVKRKLLRTLCTCKT